MADLLALSVFGVDWQLLKPFIVIGLAFGGVYALSGVGLVVLYRATGVLNLAFGAIGAAGALIAYWLINHTSCPEWLAFAVCVLFGGVLRESPSAGASALPAERVAAAFDPSFSSAQNAASLVLRLQQHLRQSPDDAASSALLGLAYEQRARETGDSAYYQFLLARHAESEGDIDGAIEAYHRAAELDPKSADIPADLAALFVRLNRPREAIEAGGSTLRDFTSPEGELGYFSKTFAVYDREGEPCGCGGKVKRVVQGGRSTFYCPSCQK